LLRQPRRLRACCAAGRGRGDLLLRQPRCLRPRLSHAFLFLCVDAVWRRLARFAIRRDLNSGSTTSPPFNRPLAGLRTLPSPLPDFSGGKAAARALGVCGCWLFLLCGFGNTYIHEPVLPAPLHPGAEHHSRLPPQYIKKQNEQTPTSRSKGIFNNENPNQSIIDQLLTTGFLVGRFGAAHRYGSARRLQALSTRLTVCGRGVCPQERLFFGGEPPLPAEQSRLLPPL
jgi:hypothetical protein